MFSHLRAKPPQRRGRYGRCRRGSRRCAGYGGQSRIGPV